MADSADPNIADEYGVTPLIHAAARGLVTPVRLLLEAGAKLDMTDAEGKSAMDYAESAGHHGVVALLQQHDVTYNGGCMTQRGDGSLTMRAMTGGSSTSAPPRMTPRVPTAGDTAAKMEQITTPRGIQMQTPRAPPFVAPLAEPITPARMMGANAPDLTFLTKKLIQLSILLEQDTVATDTAYPSFPMPTSSPQLAGF